MPRKDLFEYLLLMLYYSKSLSRRHDKMAAPNSVSRIYASRVLLCITDAIPSDTSYQGLIEMVDCCLIEAIFTLYTATYWLTRQFTVKNKTELEFWSRRDPKIPSSPLWTNEIMLRTFYWLTSKNNLSICGLLKTQNEYFHLFLGAPSRKWSLE